MPFLVLDIKARPMIVVSTEPHPSKEDGVALAQRYADQTGHALLVEVVSLTEHERTQPTFVDVPAMLATPIPGPSGDAPKVEGPSGDAPKKK